MDRHALGRTGAIGCVVLLSALSPLQAGAEPVFRCIDASGATTFSDLPCPRGPGAEAVRLAVVLHNAVTGMALEDADLRHLEAIAARAPRGPRFAGLADPARQRRCVAARKALDEVRARARRGHRGSLREARREANARVRSECH